MMILFTLIGIAALGYGIFKLGARYGKGRERIRKHIHHWSEPDGPPYNAGPGKDGR